MRSAGGLHRLLHQSEKYPGHAIQDYRKGRLVMPDLVCFSRNRHTAIEIIDPDTLRSVCRLRDTLTDAKIAIKVKLPDLEIIDAEGHFQRSHRSECGDVSGALEKVRGVRIGSGMIKILKGLLSEATDCRELAYMVEECCHAVIIGFTKDFLALCPTDPDEALAFFRSQVKDNTRLLNRCVAFAPGSSIVEGIEC